MTIAVITGVTAAAEARLAALLGGSVELSLVRRCVDLAEVVAVCAAGHADVALVSADLPGLDRSSIQDVRRHGVALLGVHSDEAGERRLREWGVSDVLLDSVAGEELVAAVVRAASSAPAALAQPVDSTPGLREPGDDQDQNTADDRGRIIAIWGTGGAPGRSVVAANLAALLAAGGDDTLLLDADTYGASQAQLFGVLDEAPGVAAATRLAEAGRLDTISFAGVAPLVSPHLRILTGLPRADRWPELRAAALENVLSTARALHRHIVVDLAPPIETDEELSYDTLAPQRNMATRTVVEQADAVVVVAAADPIGLTRLVRSLEDLPGMTSVEPTIVVTKVGRAASGRGAESAVRDALARFAGVDPLLVPDDRDALGAALLEGRTLHEHAPGSVALRAIATLARQLGGRPPAQTGIRRSGRWQRTG
ncbi:AAA family ATPase [Calidifontibacter terrae]